MRVPSGQKGAGAGGAARQPGNAAGAGAPDDERAALDARLDRLVKLGELKDKGVLTEEEFAEEKARIMGGG